MTTAPTPVSPETAMNIALTFDDLEMIHDALVEWAIQILPPADARVRISNFAAFVVRHPELFTAFTIMKGAR